MKVSYIFEDKNGAVLRKQEGNVNSWLEALQEAKKLKDMAEGYQGVVHTVYPITETMNSAVYPEVPTTGAGEKKKERYVCFSRIGTDYVFHHVFSTDDLTAYKLENKLTSINFAFYKEVTE